MNQDPPADRGKPKGRVRIDDVATELDRMRLENRTPESSTDRESNRETSGADNPIRRGSPFRGNSDEDGVIAPRGSGTLHGSGPIGELEMIQTGVMATAPIASLIVMAFALACYAWFPGGGLLVASLGVGLAAMGLFSVRKAMAAMLLVTHMAVFFGCYFTALM